MSDFCVDQPSCMPTFKINIRTNFLPSNIVARWILKYHCLYKNSPISRSRSVFSLRMLCNIGGKICFSTVWLASRTRSHYRKQSQADFTQRLTDNLSFLRQSVWVDSRHVWVVRININGKDSSFACDTCFSVTGVKTAPNKSKCCITGANTAPYTRKCNTRAPYRKLKHKTIQKCLCWLAGNESLWPLLFSQ